MPRALTAVRADDEAPPGSGGQQDLLHGCLVDAGELNLLVRLAGVDGCDLGGCGAVLEANVGGHLLAVGCGGRFAEVVDVDPGA